MPVIKRYVDKDDDWVEVGSVEQRGNPHIRVLAGGEGEACAAVVLDLDTAAALAQEIFDQVASARGAGT